MNVNKAIPILDYNQKAYETAFAKEFVTGFSHGSMVQGPILVDKAMEIINNLNAKSPEGVKFDPSRISPTLSGGSCSSISLKIARQAMINLNREPYNREKFLSFMKGCVESINKSTPSQRKEIRTVQEAFNSIIINETRNNRDIAQDKIKALAAHFNLNVESSSDEHEVAATNEGMIEFKACVAALKPGMYLLRNIKKEDNHKQETHGHSTWFYKDRDGNDLYFDPQIGLYDLKGAGGENQSEMIYMGMISMKNRFEVHSYKFHRLEDNDITEKRSAS